MNEDKILIGIDPGVRTGIALWSTTKKCFIEVSTMSIINAQYHILNYKQSIQELRFEDARLRKWFGGKGREALQGAGSIKRDCKIWEEFCRFYDIPYRTVPPKDNTTKLTKESFRNITKWEGQTSEHSRDAAMLVWGG